MKKEEKKNLKEKQLEKVVGGVEHPVWVGGVEIGMDPGYQTTPTPGGNGTIFGSGKPGTVKGYGPPGGGTPQS